MLSCEKRVTTKVREIFEKREVCLFFCAQFECALRLIKNLCNANRIPMICQFYSRTGVTTSVTELFSSCRIIIAQESNCRQSGAKECVSLCVLNHHHPAIISHPATTSACTDKGTQVHAHTRTHTRSVRSGKNPDQTPNLCCPAVRRCTLEPGVTRGPEIVFRQTLLCHAYQSSCCSLHQEDQEGAC